MILTITWAYDGLEDSANSTCVVVELKLVNIEWHSSC